MAAIKRVNILGLVVLGVLWVGDAAGVVVFDFEDAPCYGGAAEIETYMEDMYGSDITVVGGSVRDAIIPGFIPGPLGGDNYVRAGIFGGPSWFSFSFNEQPITSVSFDLGVVFSSFHVYADGEKIFSERWHFWSSDNSGTFYFDSPVTTLKFSNSCFGEIEVDNLAVAPVPEPSTLLLLALGTVMLRRKR